MHESIAQLSLSASRTKRKRAARPRENARRLRETLFFRMLTEGETGPAEKMAAGPSTMTSSLVPAWLHVSLSSCS